MNETGKTISVILLILCVLGTLAFIIEISMHSGDDYDNVNTRLLGQKLCEDAGLSYSHRELIRTDMPDDGKLPIIYCKNQTKIHDGVVIQI